MITDTSHCPAYATQRLAAPKPLIRQPSAARPELSPLELSEEAMSHPIPATLYRIAAASGCGSAAVPVSYTHLTLPTTPYV